jgi:prepilin-type N-terminal cleavage/methylation domain-containing protein
MKSRRGAAHQGFTLIELLIVIIVIGILAAVKEGVHTIQIAVVTYAAENNGVYPATEYVTSTPNDKTADNLGNRYIDPWPKNPWTGKPMANTGSNILFNTNFASMANLSVLQQPSAATSWKVVNGQLVPTVAGENRVNLTGSNGTDAQVSVSATLASGPGYGVFFRSNGDPGATTFSAYCFQFDQGYNPPTGSFVLRKFSNGGQPVLKAVSMPAGYPIYGVSHTTTISAVGNHIVCKVDGVTVIDYTDTNNPFPSGSAGLRSWSNSKVAFSSAQVQGGGGAGSGEASKGDFAYANAANAVSYGLVGWLAGNGAFVVQPLQ